ncbi:MAG: T9SS type A sorting domain-containing protein, partial [Bacteroidia bacterium]|nr:T9SS type A sorting domain-containing protein [Bacteroidia bacterium]
NNCVLSKTVSVGIYQLPNITIVPSSTRICIGESATMNANGATSYQWSTGASTSSITVSPTVNVVYNYSVVGVDNNSCTASANINLSVDACVGVTELNKVGLAVGVYPNPNNGEFTVELKNGLISNIVVTDVTGRVVLNSKTDSDKVNVNLNTFANGVYYVQVVSEGNSSVVKVVKQ